MVVLRELLPASTSTSSTRNHHHYIYDVFLSFRGIDTRNCFTDHLYNTLLDAGIITFLDDEEIETGESLKPELKSAIESSRASVIVLSTNYAESTWCLDELVLILEQKRNFNQIVIPIFYHVEPTDVRKQQSSFGEAMAKHKQRMETETETDAQKINYWAQKMESWRSALTEVADLKGRDAKDKKETDFIQEVVTDIHGRLRVVLSNTLPNLIGLEHSIKFIGSWLTDGSRLTADILTVVGMGGIGKTSLAKYVFNLHSSKFHKSSFIEDINTSCNAQFNGLLNLQKQLYEDFSKKIPLQINNVSMYTSKIENVLARKIGFIVLDDINDLDQLDALLGNKGLHPGSKIIITTRDASLTERCALFKTQVHSNHRVVFLKGLLKFESLKLLWSHAFNSHMPNEGYKEVSAKLVKYCEGNPLALKVLGSSLYMRDVACWEEFIQELKKESNSRINKVLQMSFHSLPSENDMELFKHIACFFVGKDRDLTETILNECGIKTRFGIQKLVERCLLGIGLNNELTMHSLIQEMGRDLVRKEYPKKPWKRSRLWCHEESFEVLKHNRGKGNLLGLALDMKMLDEKKLRGSAELETKSLSKMDNLMLLQLNYVQLNGSFKNFPEDIRWLCMHGFPLKSIPSNLPMRNLVVLDMSYSNIESFGIVYSNQQQRESRKKLAGSCTEDKRLLESLKTLDLSFCEKLRSVGGFFEFPALERLTARNCIGLIEICESIEQCVELVYIDMSYCHNLKRLPRSFGKLKKLRTLLLDGCNFAESQIETMEKDLREGLDNENMVATSSISNSMEISIPCSLTTLSLKGARLANESFPADFSSLSVLKELYLDGNPIVSMPSCVRSLPRLEKLTMYDCNMLALVEHPPHMLRHLSYNSYRNSSSHNQPLLRNVLFDSETSQLHLLVDLQFSSGLPFLIEGIVKAQPMTDVAENVLYSLQWNELIFPKESCNRNYNHHRGSVESQTQMMYYELGIFSTFYEGKGMPYRFSHRSTWTSISFVIPSSCNRLRGLNFCCMQTLPFSNGTFRLPDNPVFRLPLIKIINKTKKCTWIYKHCIGSVGVRGKDQIYLSHWLFGMNEMEAGDEVTITVTEDNGQVTSQCGIDLVYDEDGKIEEEEDVLGYYKSWNHIIGGDLSGFQVTTGEYVLYFRRCLFGILNIIASQAYVTFLTDNPTYKEAYVQFRAFSRRKSGVLGRTHEVNRMQRLA